MQRIFAWLKICNVKQELLAKYYIILYNKPARNKKEDTNATGRTKKVIRIW